MKLLDLRVDGFGKLRDCSFTFDPALTVVVGPNEAGKSTMAHAIAATLYGLGNGEKAAWTPWRGERFATALRYELDDGRRFEVRRDFERGDTRGVRIYDAQGKDASAESGEGRTLVPGVAHLGITADVFANAAYVPQQRVMLDGERAEPVAGALAKALDGGPREDAAAGAMKRLDAALRTFVGSERANATRNAALRRARDGALKAKQAADEARDRLGELAALRATVESARYEVARLEERRVELERQARATRATTLRARLAALSTIRDDAAALHEERARYDDVADLAIDQVDSLTERMRSWERLAARAAATAEEAQHAAIDPERTAELDPSARALLSLDEAAVAALEGAAREAESAHARAANAGSEALVGRHDAERGAALLGGLAAVAGIMAIIAIVLAILHVWIPAAACFGTALLSGSIAAARVQARAKRIARATKLQRDADEAAAREAAAGATVAAVLAAHGLTSVDELLRRRTAALAVDEAMRRAEAAATRARVCSEQAAQARESLTSAFADLLGTQYADLGEAYAEMRRRGERYALRQGIDARLGMLALQRGTQLGDEDEYQLERELAELLAAGVEPRGDGEAIPQRAIDAERAEVDRALREAQREAERTRATLEERERTAGDIALLDETLAEALDEVIRLERFKSAVTLARDTIEARMTEAHNRFARRLQDYAATILREITAGRYGELFVDPASLQISVRVPETGDIMKIGRLSAGTREQIALMVRLAMVRMLGEGQEKPPIMLDDPFAFWDDARLRRCLPVIEATARSYQVVILTASDELARAAEARGARRLELGAPLAV